MPDTQALDRHSHNPLVRDFRILGPGTRFARYLKWLTAVMLVYVLAAFLAGPDWRHVALATLTPRLAWDTTYITTLGAVLETTISPYFFSWQASHEVENEKAQGRRTLAQRRGATAHELADARLAALAFFATAW